jgi:stage II sporulation protein D
MAIVNILPLEEYLVGTLSGEMMASWNLEALKAQAVAARSYALYAKRFPKSRLFDLQRSTHDQVYLASAVYHKKFRQAVEATRGQYLQYRKKPLKAFYHSRCGGKTALATAVWDRKKGPPQRNARCPYCRRHPQRWTASFDLKQVLNAIGSSPLPLRPVKITLEKTSRSGRITSLRLGPLGREKSVTSERLRSLLGYRKLKSTLFDWTIRNGRILFRGVGSGHGVGMCQWGAQYLAEKGSTYRKILAHYYPGITVVGG